MSAGQQADQQGFPEVALTDDLGAESLADRAHDALRFGQRLLIGSDSCGSHIRRGLPRAHILTPVRRGGGYAEGEHPR
ncbi:hypothetical protein MMON_49880 [Mycolicibacterium monacense]|uniref:Uncharacterized protein n=1 Tax=Mycolicibacterium monacense TaxID=85693 RepID=A0AAD1J5X6_MYCMB|nr:hypothetical protein MMON_49880 [Mycolicibacterium monacense]